MDFILIQNKDHYKTKMAEKQVSNKSESEETLSEKEWALVRWEEFALAMEEHYHAHELWKRNPEGTPMGHR